VDTQEDNQITELRLSDRYRKAHPWVVPAITGFLSAYFMEHPGFRVQRHYDELESGMHVWICEVPATMTMRSLARRLQADIPPCRCIQTAADRSARPQYVIDCPEES
jgi:hypothetical protein